MSGTRRVVAEVDGIDVCIVDELSIAMELGRWNIDIDLFDKPYKVTLDISDHDPGLMDAELLKEALITEDDFADATRLVEYTPRLFELAKAYTPVEDTPGRVKQLIARMADLAGGMVDYGLMNRWETIPTARS